MYSCALLHSAVICCAILERFSIASFTTYSQQAWTSHLRRLGNKLIPSLRASQTQTWISRKLGLNLVPSSRRLHARSIVRTAQNPTAKTQRLILGVRVKMDGTPTGGKIMECLVSLSLVPLFYSKLGCVRVKSGTYSA